MVPAQRPGPLVQHVPDLAELLRVQSGSQEEAVRAHGVQIGKAEAPASADRYQIVGFNALDIEPFPAVSASPPEQAQRQKPAQVSQRVTERAVQKVRLLALAVVDGPGSAQIRHSFMAWRHFFTPVLHLCFNVWDRAYHTTGIFLL